MFWQSSRVSAYLACFQDLTTVSGIISDIGEVTAGSLDQWSGFHYNLTATGLWLAVVWPI